MARASKDWVQTDNRGVVNPKTKKIEVKKFEYTIGGDLIDAIKAYAIDALKTKKPADFCPNHNADWFMINQDGSISLNFRHKENFIMYVGEVYLKANEPEIYDWIMDNEIYYIRRRFYHDMMKKIEGSKEFKDFKAAWKDNNEDVVQSKNKEEIARLTREIASLVARRSELMRKAI